MLLLLAAGVTYAAFDFNFIGNTNKIETEEVSLKLLESNTNIISINNSLPMGDNEGKKQTKTFDFQVETKASRDLHMKYYLYIEPIYRYCKDLKNPNVDDNPYCYKYDKDAITSEEETNVINFIGEGFNISFEDKKTLYNLVLNKDNAGIRNFLINVVGYDSALAEDFVNEISFYGYEQYIYLNYEQGTGNTLPKAFDGNSKLPDKDSLLPNQIKIYLTDYDGNQLIAPTKISDLVGGSDGKYLLHSDVNYHSRENNIHKDKYKIKVWIDSDVDASKWNESTDLSYKFKIGVISSEVALGSTMVDGPTFQEQIIKYNDNIRKIEFMPNTTDIDTSNAIEIYDFSDDKNGSITGWIEPSSLSKESSEVYYDLYIASPNKILANPNSREMFLYLPSLQEMNANMLDVSHVYDMSWMMNIMSPHNKLHLDLSNWNTFNVFNYECMFSLNQDFSMVKFGGGWTIPFDKNLRCDPQ